VVVDGSRILASDIATAVPSFGALPPDKDLGPAPAGTMVRLFHKTQLASMLPVAGAELPDRLCVQRNRDVIPPEVWQSSVDRTMARICAAIPWKAKVLEAPHHKFPSGELSFGRAGLIVSRGSVHLWRGALVLPDKSSIAVWVRVELQNRRSARILNRQLPAGTELTAADYEEQEIWVPGLCSEAAELSIPKGMVTRRTMPSGAIVASADLRRAPAIYRGQSVELEVSSGSARFRVPSVAEHDAEVGGKVHLKSSWNGTKLVGRVTGTQKAKVE